ncbi:MAG: dephospho-CoA kinase [Acholeplasmataceae bacterium]
MSVKTVKTERTIFGLTGGIASGKTTAVERFKEHGFFIIDSDKLVDRLWKNRKFLRKLSAELGVKLEGPKDKAILSKLIFESEEARKKVNELFHPTVFKKIDKILAKKRKEKRIIIDMPLLLEVGYDEKCDYVILIYSNEYYQIERLMKRNNLTEEEALKRINAQMPLDEKTEFADVVIDNNYTIEKLYRQIDHFVRSFYCEE